MTRLALALLLTSAAVAAPVPKALKGKRPDVNGHWRLTELNSGGRDFTKLNPQDWLIEDGKITMVRMEDGRPQVVTDCGPFRLVASRDGVEAVDWFSDERGATGISPAIARVTDDEFVLVVAPANETRPTEFKPGDRLSLYRFKRVTEK
jgi:hypothetical protein